MKHLGFIIILVPLFILVIGSRISPQDDLYSTKRENNIFKQHIGSLDDEGELNVKTVLQHPTMDIRLGYPAIITPGEAHPSVEVSALVSGTIQAKVISEETGVVVYEKVPVFLEANENTTITFPGTPTEGRYKIQIDLFDDKKLVFRDAYYFTVMDVRELPNNYSVIAHPGKDGKLVYTPDYRGNRIADFSMVGYRNGMDIPYVAVKLELEPQDGDDTERIQAAINAVSAMPQDGEGFRGAVLLKRGVYEIGGTLTIGATGVVLRGEGQGDFKDLWLDPSQGLTFEELQQSLSEKKATTIIATGRERRWIIRVEGAGGIVGDMATVTAILDNYVPVGVKSFAVTNAGNFIVGDSIVVERRGNARWISKIGMDSIPDQPDGSNIVQWRPFSQHFESVITAIEGNHITINSSIVNAIENQWGGGRVYKYSDSCRITRSGVENLRAISYWKMNENGVDDTRHPDKFVELDNIRDGWVINITLEHFYGISAFLAGSNSLGITFQNSSNLVAAPKFYAGLGYDPTGRTYLETGVYTGRYGFHFAGQNGLVKDCYALHNRHAYVVGAWVTGPNVFLNSHAEKSLTWSEPHHRWSVGGLYDNIKDMIGIMNRLSFGTGHGWGGANYVAWNTEGILVAEQPPTAQNWAIGHIGEKRDGPFHTWNMSKFGLSHGYWEAHGIQVEPASLYLKQLKDRQKGDNDSLPVKGGTSRPD